MEKIKVYFLHGFLGSPGDWAPVMERLKRVKNIECEALDLFQSPWSPHTSFADWGSRLCEHVKASSVSKNILVGYSLGARLAMSALKVQENLFSKVVLLSGNPGFDDAYDDLDVASEPRRIRWIQDSGWADKFLKSPWDEVVASWNAQSVFNGGRTEPRRLEKDYDRDLLALALTQWSLAQQPNMRPVIGKNLDRVLWVVGEMDERYRHLGIELKTQFPMLKMLIASGASHRVLFDKPDYVAELVEALCRP